MLRAKGLGIVLIVLLAGGFSFAADQPNIKGATITVLSVQDPFYWGLEALNARFEKETGVKSARQEVENLHACPMAHPSFLGALL